MRRLFLLLGCLLLGAAVPAHACSMCKVTVDGHTYVGNNEDSWNTTSRIWFEAPKAGALGAAYVGYATNGFPQGGMNEAGLTFDGLTIVPKHPKAVPGRESLGDAGAFLKTILRTCRTVDEVAALASRYNRGGALDRGIVFFADRSGRYLVMEPDTLLLGNDAQYIIANFCPSTTPETERLHFGRYQRGRTFINQRANASGAAYCRALTDTMHECRARLGDGTLYSTLADLDRGTYSLYFYHDFSRPVTFRLKDEFAKGDHSYAIPTLFPASPEYQRLLAYRTPFNDPVMLRVLGSCLLLSGLAAVLLAAGLARRAVQRRGGRRTALYAGALAADLGLLYYGFLLATHGAVFYFPAPYRAPGDAVTNTFSYFPLALLAATPVLMWQGWKTARSGSRFSNGVLAANGLAVLVVLGLFGYWHLFGV